MKKVIAIAILSIFLAGAGIQSVSAQSDWTFADWCENKKRLTPEAKHTVEVLLEKAETQECDRAEEAIAQLTTLYLDKNQIEDVTPLGNLTHLTQLYLEKNQIEDVTPLGNLTHLTQLYLEKNQIVDVTPLASLKNLTGLWGNQIADATPLENLTKLIAIDFRENPLSDSHRGMLRESVCSVQPDTICRF